MNWLLVGMLTALTVSAQTPAERAQTLNMEGNRVAETGDYPEARRLYSDAIVIWRSLGDEHYRTVTNMNLLANNYLMMGSPERADALYREALLMERKLFPADIQTARTLEGLAYGLVRTRQPREALPLAEEALRIATQSTGEGSVDTALAYSSVAEVYRTMGDGARALPLYRHSRALYEKAVGPSHPRVAAILSQEGLILMQDGKLALAEQSMVQAVKLLKNSCPGCLTELSIAQSNLGLLNLRRKRYREADEAYSAAIELREKFAVSAGPELADSLQSLAVVREKEHLFDDAARLNTRAQLIRGYR